MAPSRTILFVDDEPAVLDALRRATRIRHDEWTMHFADSVAMALDIVQAHRLDAIVTDVTMPGRDGFSLLASIRDDDSTRCIPVIILTGLDDVDLKRRALDLGAVDLLNKPIVAEDLIARVTSVLRIKAYEDELRRHNEVLEQKVRTRTCELHRSQYEIVWRLAKAGEYRDEQTGNHVIRVARYSRALAQAIGMDARAVETIYQTSALHDIGKIGISDTTLLKQGLLNAEEWASMQEHTRIGHEILRQDTHGMDRFLRESGHECPNCGSLMDNELLEQAARIALCHHEQWGGGGYPNGLKGSEIPLEARIVAIADVYDALSHPRPYKSAYEEDQVLSIMKDEAPWHFDPDLFCTFLGIHEDIRQIRTLLTDPPLDAETNAYSDDAA